MTIIVIVAVQSCVTGEVLWST